ncbi:MAG: DEAD/DEAH box helicase [Brevinematales bacterium]|nr:DEAD/DEAH box helicase [Brevinematales bacterium]
MQILYDGDIFTAQATINDAEYLTEAGFLWNSAKRVYWTDNKDIAFKLAGYFHPDVEDMIKKKEEKSKLLVRESAVIYSDYAVPSPNGRNLLPFQRAGVEFAMKRENTLIADEMGLGKTVEAIGVINCIKPSTVLILCPAIVKLNWQKELLRWTIPLFNYRISVVYGESKTHIEIGNNSITIVNYDILAYHVPVLRKTTFGLIIVDESHYIKNKTAQRTRAALKLKAKRKICLTGTPVMNRPHELWAQLKFLEAPKLPAYYPFIYEYAGAYRDNYGIKFDPKNIPFYKLSEYLRTTVMIRRLKKDVLKELPPKRRQVIEIEITDVETVNLVEKEWQEFEKMSRIRDLRERLSNTRDEHAETEFREQIKQLQENMESVHNIFVSNHNIGISKIPFAVHLIRDMMENVEKIVIFAHHTDVILALKDKLKPFNPLVLIGSMNQGERQYNIDLFQNTDLHRVIICSIKASGLGITLTRASTAVFVEESWSPAELQQAEDRLHRITQLSSVNIYYLLLNNSLEAHIAKSNIEKLEMIEGILD